MATIIAGRTTALASTGVNLNATATLRYLRAKFHNTGAGTRIVTVKIGPISGAAYVGATQVDQFTLQVAGAEGCTREYGPVAVAATDQLWAGQDAGTDVTCALTGEYS